MEPASKQPTQSAQNLTFWKSREIVYSGATAKDSTEDSVKQNYSPAFAITHALKSEKSFKDSCSLPLLEASFSKLLERSNPQELSLPQCLRLCQSEIDDLYNESKPDKKNGGSDNLLQVSDSKEPEENDETEGPDVMISKVFEDINILNEELEKQGSPAPTKFEIVQQSLENGHVTVKMNSKEFIITRCDNEKLIYNDTESFSKEDINRDAEEAFLTDDPEIVIFQDFTVKDKSALSKAGLVLKVLREKHKPVMVGMRFEDSLHCVLITLKNLKGKEFSAMRWKEKAGEEISIAFDDFNKNAIEGYFFDHDENAFQIERSPMMKSKDEYYDSVIFRASDDMHLKFHSGNKHGLPELILNSEWELKEVEETKSSSTTVGADVKFGYKIAVQGGISANWTSGTTKKKRFTKVEGESKVDPSRHNARNRNPSEFKTWGLKVTNEAPTADNPKLTAMSFHVLKEMLSEKSVEELVEKLSEASMDKSVEKPVEMEIIPFTFKAESFLFRIFKPSKNNEETIDTQIFKKSKPFSPLEKVAITSGEDDAEYEYEISGKIRLKFKERPAVRDAKGYLCMLKFDLARGKRLFCGLIRTFAKDDEDFFVQNFEECI